MPDFGGVYNPANETITVELQNDGATGTLSICNSQGKEIITRQITNGIFQIDIRSFASGVYFLQFNNGRTKEVVRLIKL